MGFGLFESAFPIFFFLIFTVAFGFILITLFRGIKEWNKNNHSPRLTVPARVVSRRMAVSHTHGTHDTVSSTHTAYYVTFQVESGDRMELMIPGTEYGYMVEGDNGRLTFQGTRYLSFERI